MYFYLKIKQLGILNFQFAQTFSLQFKDLNLFDNA